MDFPVKNLAEIKYLTFTVLFNKSWNRRSKYLDLLHKLPRGYKKWDWRRLIMDGKEVRKGLGKSRRFPSLRRLVMKGLLREHKNRFSMEDLGEEMLRREVMAQMDDAYWVYAEEAFKKKKKKPKRKKKRKPTEYYTFEIEGLCKFKYPIERFCINSKYFKEAEAKAKEYLKENEWVFQKKRKTQIKAYTEKYLLSTTRTDFLPIDQWANTEKIKKRLEKLKKE